MRTTSLQFIVLAVGLGVVGCSATDSVGPPPGGGGDEGVGGITGADGGLGATGGSTQAGGAAAGGNNPGTGGAPTATGGTTSIAATGGKAATGGTTSVPATGGMTSVTATGGVTSVPATGGMTSVTATGGRATTGGTTSVTATGGKAATGGMPAAGGAKATGGTPANGGATAAGGGSSPPPGKKFFGNITTGNGVDSGTLKYSKYWDQISPENAGKWGSVQSTGSSAFNWASLDTIYAYTTTNNIIFKQHCFSWGSQQPTGTITQANVESWIKSFCERYPKVAVIDVVNEPPPHTTPSYTAALGAGETGTYPWITKAFKLARQYCGSAILILNDYNDIEYADQEQHIIDIVTDIKAHGAPIDAVGAQSHDAYRLSASALQTNVNNLASKTGLPVYITEWDIPDSNDSTQLSTLQAEFPVFWNTAAVHGVTYWGWIVGRTWKTGTGLVNGTAPRPSMTWLMGQLNRPVPPN